MASQYGQDRVVLELLGGKRDGFFLDSGAADGVRASNTELLEKEFGWTGICVEPDRQLFAMLRSNRACACVNCCLYRCDGKVDYLEGGFNGGILDEYDPRFLSELKQRWGRPADFRPPTVTKEARTIRSVLAEHGAPRVIDYWSLDTEGSELTLLRSFPFDDYAFRVLTVEHNRLPSVQEEIRLFLEGRGYQRVATIEIDDVYVNAALGDDDGDRHDADPFRVRPLLREMGLFAGQTDRLAGVHPRMEAAILEQHARHHYDGVSYSFAIASADPCFEALYSAFLRVVGSLHRAMWGTDPVLHRLNRRKCWACVVDDRQPDAAVWHNHEETCSYNGVYYLRVSDGDAIQCLAPNGDVVEVPVRAGMLLITPNWLMHRPKSRPLGAGRRISINMEAIVDSIPRMRPTSWRSAAFAPSRRRRP